MILFEGSWAAHGGQMLASQACHKQLPSVQGLLLVAAAAAAVCQTGAPEASLA